MLPCKNVDSVGFSTCYYIVCMDSGSYLYDKSEQNGNGNLREKQREAGTVGH